MSKNKNNDNKSLLEHFNDLSSSMFIYLTLFFVLTINFTALSISLHINRDSPIHIKLGNAIYAFLFGLIYLMLNYYLFRILKLRKPVSLKNTTKLFPI